MYKRYVKRILDVLLSAFALFVLGIPLLMVALLIKWDMGSPVLFGQRRIGKNDKEFIMYKFRSMTEERDANGIYLPDYKRYHLVPSNV